MESADKILILNDGNTDSSIRSSFPFESTLAVSEEFSKLTTFKIMISAELSYVMKNIVSNFKKHNIHLLFKAIYFNFSYETQQRICLQIKEQFPLSVIAQCLKEQKNLNICLQIKEQFPLSVIAQCLNEQENLNESELLTLYEQRLSEVETIENEGKVMESLLMTLFMERINDVFIKKLPKEFKNLEVIIHPEIPYF